MNKLFKFNALNTLFIVISTLLICLSVNAAPDSMPEARMKAGLIYNFIKHTQWPNEPSLTSISVTFMGNDESVYQEFITIAKQEKIRGKQLTANRASQISRDRLPQVLIVDSSLNKNISSIFQITAHTGTLLVTDNLANKEWVMINFFKPSPEEISFEINKRNITFEGLNTSNDILLNGGTPIEIAALYREMENSLSSLKSQITNTQNALSQKNAEIESKNQAIQELQQTLIANNEQIKQQQQDIQAQTNDLERLNQEFNSTATDLDYNKKILMEREQNLQQLAQEIEQNQRTLQTQEKLINDQAREVKKTQNTVVAQDQTITSQKNTITITLVMLLVFLIIIIISLRKSLKHQRELVETNEKLIASQQANIEALQSAAKLKSDFLSNISHEMRTPMHGIFGAIDILDTNSMQSVNTSLGIIKSCANSMHDIVDNILTYTEIQSGTLTPIPEPIDTHAFIAQLSQVTHQRCQEKELDFQCTLNSDIPAAIKLDKSKLTKILQHLLDNAVKFTPAGKVSIAIDYKKANTQDTIIFHIADTGLGILPEQMPTLFAPFHQNETGLSRRFGGLGIGLKIAEELVSFLGGTLTISPNGQQGTHITLSLPCSQIAETLPAHLQTGLPPRPILIVEDNIINQQVLDLILNKLGYTTLIANNGQEALDILATETPSLVLMDLQMPVMDGINCTHHIRQSQHASKDIPIIAITANLLESQKQECLDAGMNDYLGKPIEMTKLKDALDKYAPQLSN